MPALRSLIAILFLGLCLASPPLLAQSEPPSAEAVQQSLDKLAERKLAEADQKVAKASLEQTLKFLAARDEALQSLEDLKKRLSDAPRQIEENQRELERLKKTKERPVSERYSGESAARLEMLLNDRTTQQAEWQKALGEANSLSITAETRPERAQAGISSMQARILEIGSLLKAGKESGKTINADRRGELLAEQAALTVQSQLLRQELAGNNLLQDLGKSQHDLLTEKISRLEKETLDLQALISEKRREQSEKTVAELSKEGAQGAGTDSLLSQENAKNLRLSDYLLRATDRLNVLTRRNLETKQQLDNLTQSNQALEEQINVLRGSLLLSRILYKQKQALPKIGRRDRRPAPRPVRTEPGTRQAGDPAAIPGRPARPAAQRAGHAGTAQGSRHPVGNPFRVARTAQPRTQRAAQRSDHLAVEPETVAFHQREPAHHPRRADVLDSQQPAARPVLVQDDPDPAEEPAHRDPLGLRGA